MWFVDALPAAGATSPVSRRLPTDIDMVRYRLHDPALAAEFVTQCRCFGT